MGFLKTFTSALLATSFCAQALADSASPALFQDELAPTCPPSVSACHRYDYATTTVYVGDPKTETISELKTSTTVHTKTTTTIVPIVITRTRNNIGICNIVRTVTSTTPTTIKVTQTITSIEHRVTSVPFTTTSTYTEYVDNIVDCIIPVSEEPIVSIAAPTGEAQDALF